MDQNHKYERLYYFTESYPYGISEQWKRNELEVFRDYFKRIIVIPRSDGGNPVARNLVGGVEYREPLIQESVRRSIPGKLLIQGSGLVNKRFLGEFARFGRSQAGFSRLLKHAYQVALIKKHPTVREVLEYAGRELAVLYFYWGIGSADIVPFLPKNDDLKVSRFHGWDLYEERHSGGGIPFRRQLIDALDLALPCSDYGSHYLSTRYPQARHKIHTARLGTLSRGRSPMRDDGILKLVTCSSVTQVKRLDRLCSALGESSIPIRWTHIGDGNLMDEIKQLTVKLPQNVTVHFAGNLDSEQVLEYLVYHPFDLFMNVSESEGVPVSIMEAFAAGIPVYATDVGGTSEIVDDGVGKLMPANPTAGRIARELTDFHELPHAKKADLHDAAFARYEERSNAYSNAKRLAEFIISYRSERLK